MKLRNPPGSPSALSAPSSPLPPPPPANSRPSLSDFPPLWAQIKTGKAQTGASFTFPWETRLWGLVLCRWLAAGPFPRPARWAR